MAHPTYNERPHPLGYVCMRTGVRPPLDGKVQGPGWDAAPWTEPFMDIEGPEKPAPYHATRVKMLWDDECLYVGALMEEPQPWANLTLHDDVIYHDNDFEVFIDPDGDNHQYYEFEINAVNAFWDLFLVKPYRDGGPALHSFESVAPSEPTQQQGPTGWQPVQRAVWVDGAVNDPSVQSKGWGVTLAFPWSLLRQAAHRDCPPKPGDQWRINFSRVQWRVKWDDAAGCYVKDPPDQKEHNWVWSPQWAIAMHQPESWGYLQFSSTEACASADNIEANAASSMAACASANSSGLDAASSGSGWACLRQPAAPHPVLQQFVSDPTWPLRSFLMEVYNRQQERWAREGSYAGSLEELGLQPPPRLNHARLLVQATEASFIATGQVAAAPPADSSMTRLYVNEEGRFTTRTITTPSAS